MSVAPSKPSSSRPPCPFLPRPETHLDYRYLRAVAHSRGADFFERALTYGQFLWMSGETARAILSITRGLYADLSRDATITNQWPIPYAALAWIVAHHPGDSFMGNPRVSFQHQADRVRGNQAPLKSARAWAVWRLVCIVRPDLPGDPRHRVEPPDDQAIEHRLDLFGLNDEIKVWRRAKLMAESRNWTIEA